MLLVSFVIGAAAVTLLPVLPAYWIPLVIAPFGILLLARRQARWFACLMLGFCWSLWLCGVEMTRRLPARLEGQTLVLTGTVVSLPALAGDRIRFRFRLGDCRDCWSRADIMVTWYRASGAPEQVSPGETWRIPVQLDRPHGSLNPGLFDYSGWMFAHNIAATGYVSGQGTRLAPAGWRQWHHQLRAWLRTRLARLVPASRERRLLTALAIGESSQLTPRDWQVLSDTGTNHLMVISGLHIGLVAGLGYRCLLLVFGRLWSGGRRWAGLGSLVFALLYGFLAGMGLSVQRALVMAMVAWLALMLDRRIRPSTLFCIALFLVTLIDPLAVLNTGFWLSFGAVFMLLYAFAGRIHIRSPAPLIRWLAMGLQTQWAVFVGMLPLLLVLVLQVSFVSLAINVLAIPWIGIAVIPPLLVALLLLPFAPAAAAFLLHIAQVAIGTLWQILQSAAQLHWIYHAHAMAGTVIAVGLAGGLVVLAPRGLLPRWLGALLVLPLFARPALLAPGQVHAEILDVGQGLSVVVRTRGFTLLYDAGPRFPGRFDSGARIVAPRLYLGGEQRRLDAVIVSHGDNDHAGGVPAIFERFLVMAAFGSEPVANLPLASCHQARSLDPGPARVRLIPNAIHPASNNDRSCILLVTSGRFSMLLPGDIELAGEQHLLKYRLPRLDVLVAPHHGSPSSSSPALLNRLRPRYAIFSTGYHNRFGHPAPAIVARYRHRGVITYNTATDGAVSVDFKPGGGITITTARGQHKRFWYK